MSKWLKILGGITVLGLIGLALEPSPPAPSAVEAAKRAELDSANARRQAEALADRMLLSDAKERMRGRLKDPESAKFTEVIVARVTGKPIVCGYVNAKNSFGGYTGPKGFVMPKGGVPIGEDDLKERDWVTLWNQSCTDEGKPKPPKS